MSRVIFPVILLAVAVAGTACLSRGQSSDGERSEAVGDDVAEGTERLPRANMPPADSLPPAELALLETEFAEMMSGATLRGFKTNVRAGAITGQSNDEYMLGDVVKAGGQWKFEYSAGDDKLHKVPPVSVRWVGEMPLIIFSEIKIKGMAGAFSARLLIDGDQYSGTWSDGKSGGHMFGTIVHVLEKKARKTRPVKEEDKET